MLSKLTISIIITKMKFPNVWPKPKAKPPSTTTNSPKSTPNPGEIISKLQKEVQKLAKNFNLSTFLQQLGDILKNPPPSSSAGKRVHMKFPYTMSAKIAQFPYKFYYQNNWMFRYFPYGFIAAFPLFVYISRMSNSNANKAKWKEIRRHEKEEYKHRFD